MSTPEKTLKKRVREHLRSLGARVYAPVPNGMGGAALDIIFCLRGRYAEVEAKAPGNKPTARQEATGSEVNAAGGITFWFDSFEGYLENMTLFGFINQPGGDK